VSELAQFTARSLRGQSVPLSKFEGSAVLVVNTASKCGFTPQYAGLEALYRRHAAERFVILGFPCNQFGNQEPGDVSAIDNTCLLNYGVSFPMFEKIDVKGPRAHPLYGWLTARLPGIFGRDVRWNFTKFLIGRDGTPLQRFAPITKPESMDAAIQSVLRDG
jgi:glutathione peroxidase